MIAGKKQGATTLYSRVMSATLFLMIIAVFTPLIFHFGIALQPVNKDAINGEIVLGNENFATQKSVGLTGEWFFFESRLLHPENIQKHLDEASLIQGAGGWQLSDENSSKVNGYGTYFLKVHLTSDNLNLAIQLPKIESAYKAFIDNKLVASAGLVAESESEAKPGFYPAVISLPKDKKDFSLTLQVSSYHSAWGGIWAPVVIGDAKSIYAVGRDLIALSMFIIGALCVTAAFYLIQFYFRPSDKIPLAFACLCLLFFFRELTAEHMYFVLNFFGLGFTAGTKINYFTFYAGVPTVLYFMHLCFPTVFNSKISNTLYLIAGGFSLFVLLSPTRLIGYSLMTYQLFCLVVMVYVMSCLVIAYKTKQPNANMIIFGSIILGLFAINDMLYSAGLLTTGRFFSLGIVSFIISQSYVINNRFNNILAHNETLSGQLKLRNVDLQKLGTELESKVEQRTEQLKRANRELRSLVSIDSLTGALNRHGLNQDLKAAFERLRRSNEPCSVILFDFDNFKYINDSFGHDVGDKVLVAAVQVTNGLIREQDKLSRWGGEEFLVLLPETDLKGAMEIGNKIRQGIANQLKIEALGDFNVTVTGGAAEFKRDETFEAIFKRADKALYKGKRSGKNCILS